MLSMSVQCSLKTNLSIPSLPSQNPSYKSFKSCSSFTLSNKKTSSKSRIHRLFASAVTETETEPVVADTSESSVQEIQVKYQLFNFHNLKPYR